MEIFKKALKQAILEKAEAVRFEVGLAPTLMTMPQEKGLSQLGALDQQTLFELIDAIIPPNPSSPSMVREGSLSIVNFGEVKLLASTLEPLRLVAFIPPQGTLPYLTMKTQLLQQAQKAPPRPINLGSELEGKAGAGDKDESGAIENSSAEQPDFSLTHSEYRTVKVRKDDAKGEVPELAPMQITSSLDNETIVQFKSAYLKTSSEDEKIPPHIMLPLEPSPISETAETSTTLYIPSRLGNSLPESSSLLDKFEDTGTDNYHFHQSSHTDMETLNSPRPEASIANRSEHGHEHSLMETSVTAPKSESKITFGPVLPGEALDTSGSRAINSLLEAMVKRGASDLHLTMNEPPCFRVDGEILRYSEDVVSESEMRSYLLPIIPSRNREEFALCHDTDFAYELQGVARFRVNMFRDRQGVGAVLRQIPEKILSADQLDLSPAVRKLCELSKGLVIVTGPTGSGKSTTLAAMIDLVNETRSDHILTIEDPIEFVHKQKKCLINQREVHRHTKSFSRALRAALREDPDIILIGELRDLETVEIAIETAETGHLVFGTLHTNTAISTIDRIIDQFSADQQEQVRVMLAESLRGVIAQTLIKKKGGGRVAAQEILIVDRAVASLIREGNTHMIQNQMQTQKAKGNVQLNDALLALITKGLIDARDAYIKAVDKDNLLSMLQQKGISLDGLKSAS